MFMGSLKICQEKYFLCFCQKKKKQRLKKASADGLKVSEYLREIALNRKVSLNKRNNIPKINQQVYIELSRLTNIIDRLSSISISTSKSNHSLSVEPILLKEIHQYLSELRLKVIGDDWEHY